MKIIDERDKRIRSLELEISKSKMAKRHNKRKVREEYQWTGEETNFAKTVNHFCKYFLFPRYKFLKDRWQDVLPERPRSLYLLCMQRLKIPEGADKRDIWERVIVPSIRMKYSNMKCNLNNDIKLIYLSMMKCVQYHAFVDVFYTNKHFAHPLFEYTQRTPSPYGQMSWERGSRHTLNLIH